MERAKAKKGFLTSTVFFLSVVIFFSLFLRIWRINSVPVSLFGDELDVGYQAYSILKTGRDYSGNFLPFDFQGLAEWRTPLYLYSSVPTVALFGISPLGVRLPAILFGVLTVPVLYYLTLELTKSKRISEVSVILLAISPWHLQYSRAGFEVTELLFLLSLGLLIFIKSIKNNGKYLWLAGLLLVLTAWDYNTAKLFTPIFAVVLLCLYYRELFKLPVKKLLTAAVVSTIFALPLIYSTFLGGGSQRIGDINILNSPIDETAIAYERNLESNNLISKVFTNKYAIYGDRLITNYLSPFSTDFLFLTGDTNPRHTIEGMGVLYKVEFIGLLLGVVYYFSKNVGKKEKFILLSWILLGVIPSSLTEGGAVHATRLILMLPPLLILIASGWVYLANQIKRKEIKIGYLAVVVLVYIISFASYFHLYYVSNPVSSEKWWHYGWEDSVKSAVSLSSQYDKVIISTKGEPPWIFFAAWSQFDPNVWHAGYPFKKHTIEGFGEVSFIDKYSFGSPQTGGIYDWGKVIDPRTLYVANASEINVDLLHNPETLPNDLSLIKTVIYPSGDPAFYLLTHKK